MNIAAFGLELELGPLVGANSPSVRRTFSYSEECRAGGQLRLEVGLGAAHIASLVPTQLYQPGDAVFRGLARLGAAAKYQALLEDLCGLQQCPPRGVKKTPALVCSTYNRTVSQATAERTASWAKGQISTACMKRTTCTWIWRPRQVMHTVHRLGYYATATEERAPRHFFYFDAFQCGRGDGARVASQSAPAGSFVAGCTQAPARCRFPTLSPTPAVRGAPLGPAGAIGPAADPVTCGRYKTTPPAQSHRRCRQPDPNPGRRNLPGTGPSFGSDRFPPTL